MNVRHEVPTTVKSVKSFNWHTFIAIPRLNNYLKSVPENVTQLAHNFAVNELPLCYSRELSVDVWHNHMFEPLSSRGTDLTLIVALAMTWKYCQNYLNVWRTAVNCRCDCNIIKITSCEGTVANRSSFDCKGAQLACKLLQHRYNNVMPLQHR